MKVDWIAEYQGPNPYAVAPVVVADVVVEAPAFERELVLQRLTLASPEWRSPDGEIASVEPSVPSAVLVRLAWQWALFALNEVRGFLHAGGDAQSSNGRRVWLGFHHSQLSKAAFELGLQLGLAATAPQFNAEAWAAKVTSLLEACRRYHPDFQARILMHAAQSLDLPVLPFLPSTKYWQIGWGCHSRVFFETASNADGHLGATWQQNKHTTKEVLQALGMPIAPHVLVRDEQELLEGVKRIGFPCVVKPLTNGGGKGVTANLGDQDALRQAYAFARQYSAEPLMLEAMLQGEDHRLMVVAGKLIIVVRREPSFVIGDGTSTVRQLIEQLNSHRSNNLVRSQYLKPVPLDAVLTEHLQRQGLTVADVLSKGRRISLRSNANRSTGGICTDVTALVHPAVRAMAEQLAATTGLYAVGIDYLTTDISQAPAISGGAFIELNTTPGLSACVAAGFDEVELAKLILGTALARIPVSLTLVQAEALNAVLAELQAEDLNEGAGWVCGKSLQVGKARLHCATARPWASVHAALRNQCLQHLHIVCTPDELMTYGLPVDKLQQVTLVDVAIPEPWLVVLQQQALQVSKVSR